MTNTSQTTQIPAKDAPSPRGFWQRRIKEPIVTQLTQGVTPDKLALTLAVGVACGLFPCLGTWILCFTAAILLRLNQPIIQIVNQLLWPVHVLLAIPFYLWMGKVVFNRSHHFHELIRVFGAEENFWEGLKRLFDVEFWHHFGTTIFCASVVWLVSVPFIVAGIYYPVRPMLRKLAALRQAKLARKAS